MSCLLAKTGNRPMPALLPKWKNARTLIVDTNEVKVLAPPESCETDFSKLYQQAYEVMLVKIIWPEKINGLQNFGVMIYLD